MLTELYSECAAPALQQMMLKSSLGVQSTMTSFGCCYYQAYGDEAARLLVTFIVQNMYIAQGWSRCKLFCCSQDQAAL